MSKDEYPSIFSRQKRAIAFSVLQRFSATRVILKIRECSRIFPSFSCAVRVSLTTTIRLYSPSFSMSYSQLDYTSLTSQTIECFC